MSDVEKVIFVPGPNLQANAETWPEFRKLTTTHMRQVETEFEVDTGHGVATGKPGDWIAMDASGNFYPITAEEHGRIYAPVPLATPPADGR